MPTTETLRTENADGTLAVTLNQPTAEMLRLHYQFINRSARHIYLVATATGMAFYLHGLPAKEQLLLATCSFQTPILVHSLLHPRAPKPASTGKWTPWG